jgi:uncharacterized protein
MEMMKINPVWVLMGINILIFLIAQVVSNIEINMGLSPLLFTQKPWTLLTSMFLHVNVWHILSNMLALFFFGRIVYKLMGGWRFIAIYLVGGIVGNLLYLWIGPQNSLAFGASGAVYAVAGALVVLMPTLKVSLYGVIPLPLWAFVILFLGVLSLPPFAGASIAWQAHLGGLAIGLAGGFIFKRQMRYMIYRP